MQHSALRIYKGMHGAPPDERPLVSVGEVPDTFIPVVPTLVDEPETWVLAHRHDYTLYGYQVTQEDATYRLIYLLVPAGIRLYADINPYGLLLELWEILKSQGNSHALFEEQLALIMMMEHASDMHLPVMEGERPASFCADSRMQVKALLMFSLYPQLAGVSRLEIGLHCASTISLPIKANTRKAPQPEPVIIGQTNTDITPAKPSVNKKTKGKQSGRKRNVREKLIFYGFCMLAVVAVVGAALVMIEASSDSSNVVSSSDNVFVAEEKPFVAKEKIDVISDSDTIVPYTVRYNQAKREAEEREAKERAEKEKRIAREEILELVNRKDLKGCRQHRGWHEYLKPVERHAIETILRYDVFFVREKLSPINRHRIKRLIESELPFRSFDEVIQTCHRVEAEIHDLEHQERMKQKKETSNKKELQEEKSKK